jgi:hypothetical protein
VVRSNMTFLLILVEVLGGLLKTCTVGYRFVIASRSG